MMSVDRDRTRCLHHEAEGSAIERAENHDQTVTLGGQLREIRFAHRRRALE